LLLPASSVSFTLSLAFAFLPFSRNLAIFLASFDFFGFSFRFFDSPSETLFACLLKERRQGVRLGRPRTLPSEVVDRIQAERRAKRTLAAIAAGLNADRVPTAHGGRKWWPEAVRGVLARS
jgi:hypothetical protein